MTMYRSNEFRPSYGKLNELHAFVPPDTPYMACTATATKDVYEEVVATLQISGCVKVCCVKVCCVARPTKHFL